jgi:ATP-dependent DNA helicase RecQ
MDHKRLIDKAYKCLIEAYGIGATFREGQLDAIIAVLQGKRALVVQKTGWGKSLIYFLTTKILRNEGKGLSIVISPLLALINNQIEATNNFGLIARTINSSNVEEWEDIIQDVRDNKIDILFISPERLANEEFSKKVMSEINKSIGMLVIDEAHCISDWGHDFRPDYMRIINIVKFLPPNVPLLATTATANDRVVKDIAKQLGEDILVQRGPLIRDSLSIQVIHLDMKEERLAWLSENIVKMQGTGIVYCLTKHDCKLVSGWLSSCGIDAYSYYSGLKKDKEEETEERLKLEQMFINNQMKVLVATTAFGMGIDKSDIGFVIHFQKPGNVVAYYQQIGRAGRGIKSADAILLAGNEDDDITNYFINSAFPTYKEMNIIIIELESGNGLSLYDIMREVDISKSRLENCLKFLLMNGVIYKEKSKYHKSPKLWVPDMEHSESITKMRRDELQRMNEFINTVDCYMEFVAKELDDSFAERCHKCSNCKGDHIYKIAPQRDTILKAIKYIKNGYFVIEARKQWPSSVSIDGKNKINEMFQCQNGIALSSYGDAGWGREVGKNKYVDEYFSNDLVNASVELLKGFVKEHNIEWVTAVSSLRRPELVKSFAERLSRALGLPYYESVIKIKNVKQQKELHNNHSQCQNALESFEVRNVHTGNVLLVDDMVDSRWTFTVCGYKLISKGSGLVYPFALANTAGSGGQE